VNKAYRLDKGNNMKDTVNGIRGIMPNG